MVWKNVCYLGYELTDNSTMTADPRYIDTILETMGDNGITHIIINFIIIKYYDTITNSNAARNAPAYSIQIANSACSWLRPITLSSTSNNQVVYWDDPSDTANYITDITTVKQKMTNKNIKLLISLGGSPSFHNNTSDNEPAAKGFSRLWKDKASPYYAGDNQTNETVIDSANLFASDIYEITKNNQLDGIDCDIEWIEESCDIDSEGNSRGALFLATFSSFFKGKYTEAGVPFIVTHAPQTPYFHKSFNYIYNQIYTKCPDIDFFNVQYYSNGDYRSGHTMFVDDTLFDASVLQLMDVIPSYKIVAGLGVDANENGVLWPGGVPYGTLSLETVLSNWEQASVNYLQCQSGYSTTYAETKLNDWFLNGSSPGGAMMWTYNTNDPYSKDYMGAFFININSASVGSDKILTNSLYEYSITTPMTISNVPAGYGIVICDYPATKYAYLGSSTGKDYILTWTISEDTTFNNGDTLTTGEYYIGTPGDTYVSDPFYITDGTVISDKITTESVYGYMIGTPMTISNVPAGYGIVICDYPATKYAYLGSSTGTDYILTWTISEDTTFNTGDTLTPGEYYIGTPGDTYVSDPFTITQNTVSSFFYVPKMDDFYENSTNTHTMIHSQFDSSKQLLVPYGGNDKENGTSECISYYLHYLVEKFMLTNNTELFTKIIYLINTITELSYLGGDGFEPIYFPIWAYNVGTNLSAVNTGNAQDSNQQILQNLIKLYLNDSTLLTTSSSDLLITTKTEFQTYCTQKGLTMPSNSVNFKENLTRIIKYMITNILDGYTIENGNNANGNFGVAYLNGSKVGLCFGAACIEVNQYAKQTGGTVRDKKYSDYVNYSLYILIDRFLELNPLTVSRELTITSLKFQLTWIETELTKKTYDIYQDGEDTFEVVFNRLSYQLTEFLLLYKYGNTKIGILKETIGNFYDLTMIQQMKNIMTMMIQLEVDKHASSLQSSTITYLIYPAIVGDGNNTGGYSRHMSYRLFMLMNGIIGNRSDGNGTYYLEKHSIDEWFGINDDTIPNSFYSQAAKWSSGGSVPLNYFSGWNDNSTNSWANNNSLLYFNFVLNILHVSNYWLYINNV
jgi:hypothetical protein